jgi:hypothetical protein
LKRVINWLIANSFRKNYLLNSTLLWKSKRNAIALSTAKFTKKHLR